MIQKFLPNIDKGDKRIILINGKAVGAVNRIPEQNKIVSNLVQGGSAHKTVITDKEQKICDLLKDDLINNNIMLAGIDVIDGYLTEINITSPTGIQAINRLNDVKLESIFWDEVEKL